MVVPMRDVRSLGEDQKWSAVGRTDPIDPNTEVGNSTGRSGRAATDRDRLQRGLATDCQQSRKERGGVRQATGKRRGPRIEDVVIEGGWRAVEEYY
jgi:hypothetical protein